MVFFECQEVELVLALESKDWVFVKVVMAFGAAMGRMLAVVAKYTAKRICSYGVLSLRTFGSREVIREGRNREKRREKQAEPEGGI